MPTLSWRLRAVPLIVACPLFLQNLDTTVMATALPTMATSLGVPVLDLNLAITSYLLSLAIFLPASAWLVGRFGPRRVFCAAVLVFSAGSALCAAAGSLAQLVACRLLQGMGGSMMVPVGRTILLRNLPAERLVEAMVWFTIPGALGRLVGPLFSGAILSVASWRWIFLVNIPFGLLGVALAWWLIEKDPEASSNGASLDLVGLGLLAAALAGILGGLEMAGKSFLPVPAVVAMAGGGMLALWLYVRRSRHMEEPVLDFGVLRFRTFRISVVGGFPLRVALGAAPFLLPLMLQLGFGLSALETGWLMMVMGLGSLASRAAVTRSIRAFGFRSVLILSAVLATAFYAAYGFFSPATPKLVMYVVLFLGGVCTSMTMVALNTVGYTEIPQSRTPHATAMAAMSQQLSLAAGVVLGATLVSLASQFHQREPGQLGAADFPLAFAVVALLSLWSAFNFRRLALDAGAEMRAGRP